MTLGIIGTAGRGPDLSRLKGGYHRSMLTVAQVVAEMSRADTLVSGGSAWSDHLAVQLYLNDCVRHLFLHLPCSWVDDDRRFEATSATSPGARLNELHTQFKTVTGIDPFEQLAEAVAKGAKVHVNRGGFKARNTDIANWADAMLAFTFGNGPLLAEGGTMDTMTKFLARRGTGGLTGELTDGPLDAYHFDLNSKRLHTL